MTTCECQQKATCVSIVCHDNTHNILYQMIGKNEQIPNKKLLVAKGIATRSKDATSSSWPYYE